MAKGVSPKLKILYLIKILLEKTDENHDITMEEIISYLKSYGIVAERKGIYCDFNLLENFGIEVIMEKRNRNSYYKIVTRQFELAELKLLVDSVQSARFISEKKSNDLIKKIEGMASKYEAESLQHEVFVTERIKTSNERVFYNIDAIHNAIAENSMISFQYFTWDEKKNMILKHDGKVYTESPWAMTLAEENYYLVCFDEEEGIKYFRVDKMTKISILDRTREGRKEFEKFDIADYAKKRFRMYDGKETKVKLRCKNSFANAIIDRFGKEIFINHLDDGYFETCVEVAVSKQFYAWILAMGEGVEITGPDEVLEEVRAMIKELSKQYEI